MYTAVIEFGHEHSYIYGEKIDANLYTKDATISIWGWGGGTGDFGKR